MGHVAIESDCPQEQYRGVIAARLFSLPLPLDDDKWRKDAPDLRSSVAQIQEQQAFLQHRWRSLSPIQPTESKQAVEGIQWFLEEELEKGLKLHYYVALIILPD